MGQNDLRGAIVRQGHGETGGVLVAEVTFAAQDALLEIVGVGAAAQRLNVVIGFQNGQIYSRQDLGGLLRHIAGVSQKTDTAVRGVNAVSAGTGSIMRDGKGCDRAVRKGGVAAEGQFPAPILQSG